LAEFERELIVERTKSGLTAARARGRNGGRPAAKVRLAQVAMANRDTDAAALAKELGVTRQTIYRHAGPDGALRPDGERLLARR
jgi:DNA invertase Pin-like site-specific DNA recombinase